MLLSNSKESPAFGVGSLKMRVAGPVSWGFGGQWIRLRGVRAGSLPRATLGRGRLHRREPLFRKNGLTSSTILEDNLARPSRFQGSCRRVGL